MHGDVHVESIIQHVGWHAYVDVHVDGKCHGLSDPVFENSPHQYCTSNGCVCLKAVRTMNQQMQRVLT